uniref:CSON006706 protein n=1 Tax=Culicoides sonorensis TaxID=179676 RepID=A0A336MY67_CULSO
MDEFNKKFDIDKQSVVFVSHYEKWYNDDKELLNAFRTFGNIVNFKVLTNKKGIKIAYIQYDDPVDAKRVIYRFIGNKDEEESNFKIGILTGGGDSCVKLFVKNLSSNIDDDELRFIFEKYGEIKCAYVKTDLKKESLGFGFVTFNTADAANRAKNDLNGEILYQKPLMISYVQEKSHREAYLLALNENLLEGYQPPPKTVQDRILRFTKSMDTPKSLTSSSPIDSMTEKSFLSSKTKTPPPVFTGSFIKDQSLLKDVLSAQVGNECRMYSELIVTALLNRPAYELNVILKDPNLLKQTVKKEIRELVF